MNASKSGALLNEANAGETETIVQSDSEVACKSNSTSVRCLLERLGRFQQTMIVTHDNPDPDAVATGWALWELIRSKVGHPVRFVAGGQVLRAENRQMLSLLEPPLELVDRLESCPNSAIVLVDCGVSATHHLLTGTNQFPLAVIDHHDQTGEQPVDFVDIRPTVAASATIAASYLWEAKVVPSERLATALVYALRTETRGVETAYSRLDREMLTWLTERANPETLARIENAPLRRNYYSDLLLALENTYLFNETAFCLLPKANAQEIVAEVADLLVRGEEIKQVFCGAVINGDLLVSVRTARDAGNATELLLATLAGIGHGGGHDHRAGGKISGLCLGERLPDEIADDLRARWLAACGVLRTRAKPLVPRQRVVKHLT